MTLIDMLRLASIGAWAIVTACLFGSAWRAVRGRTYPYDNFRAAFFFVGLLMIGFGGRWFVAPSDQAVWTGLYALSCLLAFFVLRVARAHGRGL